MLQAGLATYLKIGKLHASINHPNRDGCYPGHLHHDIRNTCTLDYKHYHHSSPSSQVIISAYVK